MTGIDVTRVLLVVWLCVAFDVAPAAADVLAGKDVTSAGSVPMSAFLRTNPGPDGTTHVDIWEVRGGSVVTSYDVDMTKLLHMIVVSDDLTDFRHVHPALQPDGHFTIDLRLNQQGAGYHIYVDGLPKGAGRHVFRFDLPSRGQAHSSRYVHSSRPSVNVGPYTVAIDPTTVPIGEIATIDVRITKDGRPATDLHPYLGMMAHGVFIGTRDLAYMHAHGMTEEMLDMAAGANDCGDGMLARMPPMPPNLTIGNTFELDILAPSEQSYDLWLQFVGGKTLYTAPLLVTTR